jgi:hypothetical protein
MVFLLLPNGFNRFNRWLTGALLSELVGGASNLLNSPEK